MIRRLLELGIREEKLQLALDLVRERRVSVWKAAEMAGIDYRERCSEPSGPGMSHSHYRAKI